MQGSVGARGRVNFVHIGAGGKGEWVQGRKGAISWLIFHSINSG